jgi:hypothetical protein
MYSLGIILLQMLTGKSIMLSVELNKDSDFFKKLEIEIPKNFGYDVNLVKLVKKCINFF